jgi:hypothetical protein
MPMLGYTYGTQSSKSTLVFHHLEKTQIQKIHTILPFQLKSFDQCMKYLGFHLKGKDYSMKD